MQPLLQVLHNQAKPGHRYGCLTYTVIQRYLHDIRPSVAEGCERACLSQQLMLPSAAVASGINMLFMPLEVDETKTCFQQRRTGANPGEA